MNTMKKPELVVAAGDWESLSSALEAGADAIYFGIKQFNLRNNAANFEVNEIPKIMARVRDNQAKAYLTLNAIVYDSELRKLKRVVKGCAESGIDAIICWDFAVIEEAFNAGIPVHISTQASVSNFSSLLFFAEMGVKRIVLARECSLKMIAEMIRKIDEKKLAMTVEVFVHGAMCISISGRCFISEYLFGRSANRGDCLQPCRRQYRIKDLDEEGEVCVEDGYILSPKDLCTVDILDQLIETGIGAFKIEGRTRSSDYIKVTTEVYRSAIDSYFRRKKSNRDEQPLAFTNEQKDTYIHKLRQVYNREFSHGFYLGKPHAELSGISGSGAQRKKVYLGEVLRFFKKISVAEVLLRNSDVSIDEELIFTGKKTGTHEQVVKEMESNHARVSRALKGTKVAIKTDAIVRKNDKVFLLISED